MARSKTVLKIGTSGFLFDDWVGHVYPSQLHRSKWLRFYEQQLGFNTLEVNYTYYALPKRETTAHLVEKTSAAFVFIVKLFRDATHKRELGHLPAFLKGIAPIKEAGKLGGLLAQFPTAFEHDIKNLDYLKRLRESIVHVPLIVEFRHRSWLEASLFSFLKEHELTFCCVDQPAHPVLLPFFVESTTNIGYIRFHGRSSHWFKASREERYNYLYSNEELKQFVPAIQKLKSQTAKTFLLFNNCHLGQSVKNALRIKEMLGMPNPAQVEPKLF